MKGSSPAFTKKHGGIVSELQTKVKIKAHSDETSFSEEFVAIWDTGATNSAITKSVVAALGLEGKHVKKIQVIREGRPSRFDVQVSWSSIL